MARSFLTSAILTENVRNHDTAVYLAQGIIEKHKAAPYGETASLDGVQSFQNHPGFKYTLKVTEEEAHFKIILVAVSYLEAGKEKQVELTATIADYKDDLSDINQ
ncbi:MAG TPA: hypothetical protein VFD15_06110 [Clostridia bacterium]|nr:hypothetical protein [Clostridia bacterium]